ncbi:MAG: hypothetical protein HN936_18465 [Bacteroidetes bacterium]|jgi:hypothetical protein|nr:hypothetical protein [Bacteroidota bacterium]MBT4400346.1 hypothetical protein [Bacteroidota bacterium]MBT4410891.1 hypothetical protein [Bacteroidota bacterium]MBT7095235.1 hypothetical protein [Bacteroidota bacterium]MBT7463364.1 hypothetical protein [Bacteroidota bacterium]
MSDQALSFSAFPNPTSGHLYVKFDSAKEFKSHSGMNKLDLDLHAAGAAPGYYVLVFKTQDNRDQLKILVR